MDDRRRPRPDPARSQHPPRQGDAGDERPSSPSRPDLRALVMEYLFGHDSAARPAPRPQPPRRGANVQDQPRETPPPPAAVPRLTPQRPLAVPNFKRTVAKPVPAAPPTSPPSPPAPAPDFTSAEPTAVDRLPAASPTIEASGATPLQGQRMIKASALTPLRGPSTIEMTAVSPLAGPPTIQMTAVSPFDANSSLMLVGGASQGGEIEYRGVMVSSEAGMAPWNTRQPQSMGTDLAPAPQPLPLFRGTRAGRVEIDRPIDPRLFLWVEPASARSAGFRTLRNALLARGVPRVIAVTSAAASEGRTTAAANLALALSELPDRRALLIEGHIPNADLARLFRIRPPSHRESPPEGQRRVQPYDVVQVGDRLDLACVHPGPDGVVPAFDLRAFRAAIDAFLEYDYDSLIIDCGPVLGCGTTPQIVEIADSTLMVVHAGKTSRSALTRAVGQVGKERMFGLVVNRA